ncbi:MAG: hypothetical protein DRH11_18240, partial [Deltaproteobacteria bacterium]
YAERDGIESEVERIPINWEGTEEVKVEPDRPALWKRLQRTESTKESYEFLDRSRRLNASPVGLTITVGGAGGVREWVELTTYEEKKISPDLIEECLNSLRKIQTEGQVTMEAKSLYFESGQDLLDWVEEVKTELGPSEIKQ